MSYLNYFISYQARIIDVATKNNHLRKIWRHWIGDESLPKSLEVYEIAIYNQFLIQSYLKRISNLSIGSQKTTSKKKILLGSIMIASTHMKQTKLVLLNIPFTSEYLQSIFPHTCMCLLSSSLDGKVVTHLEHLDSCIFSTWYCSSSSVFATCSQSEQLWWCSDRWCSSKALKSSK